MKEIAPNHKHYRLMFLSVDNASWFPCNLTSLYISESYDRRDNMQFMAHETAQCTSSRRCLVVLSELGILPKGKLPPLSC